MKDTKLILETNRLRLREYATSDLNNVMKMFSDAETMRFHPNVQTREEGAAWIAAQQASYAKDGCGAWACELRDSGQFIGQVGLSKQEVNGQNEINLFYTFLPAFTVAGYGGEILRGCMLYGFEKYKVAQIISLIRPENATHLRLAQRLGMTQNKTAVYRDTVHEIWGMKRRG
jgi:RimJ/RimL family protein N-acetyltransferase